ISILLVAVFTMLTTTQCNKDNTIIDRCSLEPESGICKARIPKYYFDEIDNECKEFIWGGCGGVVPFDTMEECENQCNCDQKLSNIYSAAFDGQNENTTQ
ncbi:MAG: hypothetical protein EA361_03865, partial [Bacteroidetes bacterium]